MWNLAFLVLFAIPCQGIIRWDEVPADREYPDPRLAEFNAARPNIPLTTQLHRVAEYCAEIASSTTDFVGAAHCGLVVTVVYDGGRREAIMVDKFPDGGNVYVRLRRIPILGDGSVVLPVNVYGTRDTFYTMGLTWAPVETGHTWGKFLEMLTEYDTCYSLLSQDCQHFSAGMYTRLTGVPSERLQGVTTWRARCSLKCFSQLRRSKKVGIAPTEIPFALEEVARQLEEAALALN
eukprot:c11236_g1_i1.p1 GENE.c11236_g1_i1~~c11236_g1_i1.p1  ORF type:complete len:235 (+),score=46.55 c11236_g1_i1:38-742(+)